LLSLFNSDRCFDSASYRSEIERFTPTQLGFRILDWEVPNIEWPFPNLAYADMLDVIDRFNTNETTDLVGVYDQLIGKDSFDPFEDSGSAVDTFESGEWEQLLLHNLADIQRTRELAVLASAYVPQSDFQMKSLAPPK
jgi:hypothetical protein